MCEMISCLVDREGRVYAKDGVHSHTAIAKALDVDEDRCLKYEFRLVTKRLVQDFFMDCAPFEAKKSHDDAAQAFFDKCASTPERLIAFVKRGNFEEDILFGLLTINARDAYGRAVEILKKKSDRAERLAEKAHSKLYESADREFDKVERIADRIYFKTVKSAKRAYDKVDKAMKLEYKLDRKTRELAEDTYCKSLEYAERARRKSVGSAEATHRKATESSKKELNKVLALVEKRLNKVKKLAWIELFSKSGNRIDTWKK